MLSFNVRPKIYGLVRDEYLEDMAYIRWAIDGLFNMEEEDVSDTITSPVYLSSLQIVRDSTDHLLLDDTYLDTFFEYVGTEWQIRSVMPSYCEFCNGVPRNVFPPHRYSCRRMNYRSQLPLIQLYFDLRSDNNNHLSNRQKRYQCYRYYISLVYKTLGARVRKRVCPCVEAEIGFNFPNPDGEERVGFRN